MSTVNLDPLIVIQKTRELAAADYGKSLMEQAVLRTELAHYQAALSAALAGVMAAAEGPEDGRALELSRVKDELSALVAAF